MSRRDELLKAIDYDDGLIKLVDEMVFLESQILYLKTLPFIRVNPKDSSMQKTTPAAKLYKELLQQYTNIVKILTKTHDTESLEESPLRKWMDEHINQSQHNMDT